MTLEPVEFRSVLIEESQSVCVGCPTCRFSGSRSIAIKCMQALARV
jgi:hypothetical protein